MAYTKPVEVVAPPYVPYTPPNGGAAPPYVPYIPPPTGGTPPPYTPPPDYGFKPPEGIATMALEGWYNPKTGQTFLARSGGYTPPNSDWVRGDFGPDGKITPRTPPKTSPPPDGGMVPPYFPPGYATRPPDGGMVPPYFPPGYATRPPVADPRDSRGGGGRTAPEAAPGEGFNPSPAFARTMLDAGKTMSNYPVMAPLGIAAKVVGSLATKYGSYLSTVAERNEAARNAAANPNSGGMLGNQSSRVRSQLRSNEGYGDGPAASGPAAPGPAAVTPQQAAAADADRQPVRETSRESGGGSQSGGGRATGGRDTGGGARDASGGGDRGTRGGFAHGGIAALSLYKSKTGRSPKKPK